METMFLVSESRYTMAGRECLWICSFWSVVWISHIHICNTFFSLGRVEISTVSIFFLLDFVPWQKLVVATLILLCDFYLINTNKRCRVGRTTAYFLFTVLLVVNPLIELMGLIHPG